MENYYLSDNIDVYFHYTEKECIKVPDEKATVLAKGILAFATYGLSLLVAPPKFKYKFEYNNYYTKINFNQLATGKDMIEELGDNGEIQLEDYLDSSSIRLIIGEDYYNKYYQNKHKLIKMSWQRKQ